VLEEIVDLDAEIVLLNSPGAPVGQIVALFLQIR
jgi:hypothetical protein